MTSKHIRKLADFFYSSNSANDVPCRISLSMGMGGQDLNKQEFIEFFMLLNNSINLRQDLADFILVI